MACAIALRVDLAKDLAGQYQLGVVYVYQNLRLRQQSALSNKILQGPMLIETFPFIHTLPEEPHAIHIFEKTGRSADASEVGEVQFASLFRNARRIEHRSYKRPGARADKGPVFAPGRNRSNRRRCVMAGGHDQARAAKSRQRAQWPAERSYNGARGHN